MSECRARWSRPWLLASLLTLLTLLSGVPGSLAAQDPVVLLHWNDFHGQVLPRKSSSGELRGGFRGLATLVDAERARTGADRVLLLDAGDWFQGTPEGNLPRGRFVIDLYNAIGVDAAAVGNHEFDFGVENLVELVGRARFPVLSANSRNSDGSPFTSDWLGSTIIERGGIRFGIVGVVTEDTARIVRAEVARELELLSATEAVRTEIAALRAAGAECLVVLSHLGVIAERRLAEDVPGIDLIVGGHSHTLVPVPWVAPTTGTVVAQAQSSASHLGRLEVFREGDGFRIGGGLTAVPGRTEPTIPEVEAVIASYRPEIDGVMDEQIGSLETSLIRVPRITPDSRVGWHPQANPLGVWIARSMAEAAGTTIGLHNRGGVRSDLLAGEITARELFEVSPFGNSVVVCSMQGSVLREVVERALEDPQVRFDVTGMRIGWTHADDFGPWKELVSIEIDGLALDPTQVYEVATNDYLSNGGDGWDQFLRGPVRSIGVEVYEATVQSLRSPTASEQVRAALDEETYVQEGTPGERTRSLIGLFAMLVIAWLISTDRRTVPWRIVIWGIALQATLAALILRTGPGRMVFDGAKAAFDQILLFSMEGSQFVFGPLADPAVAGEAFAGQGWIFAFQVAGTIILVSSVTAILYHIGVMQVIVYVLAKGMQLTMRTSGAESLAAAANIFVGQTEAPLVVRPYLAKLTASETMSLMTGGMATVAGGVLAAYVGFGIDGGHLLAASVMSAPAALAIAKLMVPEKEHPATAADVPFALNRADRNLLDAACRGASDGLKLSINVMAMLIAFTALVALVNWGIGSVHSWFLPTEVLQDSVRLAEERWTLQGLLGYAFAPIAWLLGVPGAEIVEIGSLLGIKMTLNEFISYQTLSELRASLSPRSTMLATYALCGFANFASIAIQIGGISALEEGIRPTLARFGFRAMLGGTLAALMTACVAGVLS